MTGQDITGRRPGQDTAPDYDATGAPWSGRHCDRLRAGRLLLLRHGQSTSNAEDVFTGWTDVPLTELGRDQAVQAGQLLRRAGALPTSVHTSLLRRSICTAEIVTAVAGRSWLPVHRSWRLNERHYGALTGRRKAEVAGEVDPGTFQAWRRSYATAPPPMPTGSPFDVADDLRYADLPPEARPRTESLADVLARLLPFWTDCLVPEIRAGEPAGGGTRQLPAGARQVSRPAR